ncbi:ArsR family transcriptional regulator [Halobacteriales archaeon QS_1_68_20]|nr:MAG: ArsR family transcriptional regulator [Halobacteriales archaeon QS_1_68_20]
MTDSETETADPTDGPGTEAPPTTGSAPAEPSPTAGSADPASAESDDSSSVTGTDDRDTTTGAAEGAVAEPDGSTAAEGVDGEESGTNEPAGPAPSDAFGALGNEVRMGVLRELAAAEREVGDDDVGDDETSGLRTFSDLFEASDADTSAGFAYHLRQLDGHYVRKVEDDEAWYELTYAGRKVARAIAGGTFTDSVTRDAVPVEDPCPFCETEALELRSADNYTSVACRDCERRLLTLPFPPGGHRSHDDADLPRAFDRHHRHRIALMADGVCPECGAAVEGSVERPPENLRERLPEDAERVWLAMTCESCGHRLRCPVTLSVLGHPAVVSFYRDHDEDVRERPLWNVGAEWRETVVSTEPWCVLVSTRLDEDVLDLFLDQEGTVVATRRSTVE